MKDCCSILQIKQQEGAGMKANRNTSQVASMTNEDRRLIVETLGEMRELKGEMKEFKEHVISRVQRLEKKETERSKEAISVISILISGAALAVSIIINFFWGGNK
jgi:L-lactate utilization protein LutB